MTTLSRKARYALRALYALANDETGGPVLIADLAEREHIPHKFLELILLELRNAGILRSKKGKGGGYALARPPREVTLGQIIRVVDGPLAPIPCVSEESCGTRMVMKEVRDAIAKILDGTTLADVCERVAKVGRGPGTNVAYSI
jgi:Rrf2 family protein